MESIFSNERNQKYNKMKPIIKIGIAYHKRCNFYQSDMFIPIQVGAARSNSNFGIQKDSEGNNISFANAYCSEMSASYWLWKNCEADYKGLFHYRRFLTFKKQCVIKRFNNALLLISHPPKLLSCKLPTCSNFSNEHYLLYHIIRKKSSILA